MSDLMFQTVFDLSNIHFTTSEMCRPLLVAACNSAPDIARYVELGTSEEGRPISAVVLGNGDRTVSLIAGAHSDEPAGPETLRLFVLQGIRNRDELTDLFEEFTFVIVPHINPDGEAKNQPWIVAWPSATALLQHIFREPPGRDLEFGFPQMRKENRLVSEFLRSHAPFSLHMSLHGMAYSDGVMLLIEKNWIERTQELRKDFSDMGSSFGLALHDHDRKGEKGFQYIGPGYTTTPEGTAMRAYFKSIGDPKTARLFHDSSMEFVRKLGGDPLCLVTELPLLLIRKEVDREQPGVPVAYLDFKKCLPNLRVRVLRGEDINHTLDEFKLETMELNMQARLQLHAMELGLEVVSRKK
ncbi:peptidase M14 [candidate division KSB1 bacterium]|nr:peptidase M14 [candidate division KSB1 bacterium]